MAELLFVLESAAGSMSIEDALHGDGLGEVAQGVLFRER